MIRTVQCEKCGFLLPEEAEYCPSCGYPVVTKSHVPEFSATNIYKIIQAGVTGAFLSTMFQTFFPPSIDLFFLPSFASCLLVIYLFKAKRLEESIAISMSVYLLEDGILSALFLGSLYAQNISLAAAYGNYVPTLLDVIMYSSHPITALIAGYIGSKFVTQPKKRETPSFEYRRKEEPGGVIYAVKKVI